MIDKFLIQILFIFFPGIAGVILINYVITPDKKLKVNEGIAYSFVLGVLSYLPLSFFFGMNNIFLLNIIQPKEIFYSFLIALFYSAIIIYCISKEIIHTVFRMTNISNKLGTEYIVQSILSSKDKNFNFDGRAVAIRYQNKEIVYIGTIKAIGVTKECYIEILLYNVDAYFDNKSTPSYQLDNVIIMEKPENIVIEVYPIEIKE